MISDSSDGRVSTAIASEGVDLGLILSPVQPQPQKLEFTALNLMLSIKRTVRSVNDGDDNL